MQTNIKLLNHDTETFSSIFLNFNEEDITELTYDMARSSIFRVEKRYHFEDVKFSHCDKKKDKKVNGYFCKKVEINLEVKKTKTVKTSLALNKNARLQGEILALAKFNFLEVENNLNSKKRVG